MDRQTSWNNISNTPIFSNDTNMSYVDLLDDDSLDMNTLTLAQPNSSRHSPTINEGPVSRMEGSQTGSSNIHTLINLNYSPNRSSEANNNMVNNSGSRKRKEIDGGYTSESSSFFSHGESSSMHPASLHQNANTAMRIEPLNGSGESSNRNCRIRISPPTQQVPVYNYLPINQDATNSFVPWNLSNPNSVASAQNMHSSPMNIASSSRAIRNSSSVQLNNTMTMSRNVADVGHLNSTSRGRTLRQCPNPRHCTRAPQQVGNEPSPLHIGSRQNININVPPSNININVPPSNININVPPSGSLNTTRNMHESNVRRVANVISNIQESYGRSENGTISDLSTREGRRRFFEENFSDVFARGRERLNLEGLLLLNHALLNGWTAEVHDRHSDMRLDVDNMSYEELLELEERIGDVNTGLNEEKIMKCLKQRKYISLNEETADEVEPCCICQEIIVEMDDVGRLDCGHDFHAACIKKWLTLKNSCPICKTVGLASSLK